MSHPNRPVGVVLSIVAVASACQPGPASSPKASVDKPDAPAPIVSNLRRLTFAGRRAGEAYFSADGEKLVFQSEREPGNPFYQIYTLDLRSGKTKRISPGQGKTTCAWIHPLDVERILFASTHHDPASLEKQREELDMRASGEQRRYAWDYDPEFEIYERHGDALTNLTNVRGYDAEGSYSPDGTLIAFASNRRAFSEGLDATQAERVEVDPAYFIDIYVMKADGSDVRRLTESPGYDGGPFFSPDGKRIVWRRFNDKGTKAEIWTMNIDGTDQRQITRLGAMSWAPYYHPSGDSIIFATNLQGFANFELYLVDVDGKKDPIRVTELEGFDGLPVFAPDGSWLVWASQQTGDGTTHVFAADWNHAAARARLGLGGGDATAAAAAVTPPAPVAELASDVDKAAADPLGYAETRLAQWGFSVERSTKGLTARSAGSTEPTPILLAADTGAQSVAVLLDAVAELQGGLTAESPPVVVSVGEQTPEVPAQGYLRLQASTGADVRALGAQTGREWAELLEQAIVPTGLSLVAVHDGKLPAAAAAQYRKRIPALTIEIPNEGASLSTMARVLTRLARAVRDRSEPLTFTPIVSKPEVPAPEKVYLGTIPDYTGGDGGVALTGVQKDGPAQRAGIEAGDVIVEVDGVAIEGLQAYADALARMKVGVPVTIVVERAGERHSFDVTPTVRGR